MSFNNDTVKPKSRRILKAKYKDLIFYSALIAYPVLQFCIFYIGVNIHSVALAFQDIDVLNNTVTWTFDNFARSFKTFTTDASMLNMAKTSVMTYALLLFIGTPLGLLFSFYIYKKLPVSGAFRVILFLPSIISAIVMTAIFNSFVERAIPEIVKMFTHTTTTPQGLLENTSTRYGTLVFYSIWVGFGTNVLMYSNGMSGISDDIVDSAHLDGCTGIKEFWHISLPLIYPTITTFLVTGVAGIFTNQLNLFSFYGTTAPIGVRTYGYYFYMHSRGASKGEYPPLAATGLIMTVIVVPLTLFVKWALEKFGPKED